MRKPGSRKCKWVFITASTMAVACFIAVISAGCGSGPQATVTLTTAPPAPAAAPQGGLAGSVTQVVQKVKPAVVQITNEQQASGQFNQPFTVPAGVGSGVIYDSAGHIITNNHVIEGAQKLLVTLPDGRSFDGKVIGSDARTDVAVIQIKGSNLPVAVLGDATKLQVGEWVVAIGNALALPGGPTVTAGVISALGRTVQEPASSSSSSTQGPYLFNVIQTDAAINPGNSGGPLVNLSGQVVGLNTLVAGDSQTGGQAEGIGFAISINTAGQIAQQLISTGKVVHPYIGITYEPLDPLTASQLGISANQGALVVEVASGSPAAAAGGLKPRDVITAVNGKILASDSDLAQILNSHKPGDTLSMDIQRGGKKITLKITLANAP